MGDEWVSVISAVVEPTASAPRVRSLPQAGCKWTSLDFRSGVIDDPAARRRSALAPSREKIREVAPRKSEQGHNPVGHLPKIQAARQCLSIRHVPHRSMWSSQTTAAVNSLDLLPFNRGRSRDNGDGARRRAPRRAPFTDVPALPRRPCNGPAGLSPTRARRASGSRSMTSTHSS